jgi:hypothetical protein
MPVIMAVSMSVIMAIPTAMVSPPIAPIVVRPPVTVIKEWAADRKVAWIIATSVIRVRGITITVIVGIVTVIIRGIAIIVGVITIIVRIGAIIGWIETIFGIIIVRIVRGAGRREASHRNISIVIIVIGCCVRATGIVIVISAKQRMLRDLIGCEVQTKSGIIGLRKTRRQAGCDRQNYQCHPSLHCNVLPSYAEESKLAPWVPSITGIHGLH